MNAPLTHRRGFLAGGALTMAFSLSGPCVRAQPVPRGSPPGMPGDLARNRELDSWLRIDRDGRVTLKTGKVELGQGILTAFGQICADELEVDLGRVEIVSGDTRVCPREGPTAGSFSMSEGGTSVRLAAAEARAILLDLAAARLAAPAASLTVSDGVVKHPASGKTVAYGALVAEDSFHRPASGEARPRPPAAHRYVGRSSPRRDLPAKLTGDAIFVQDLKAPNLVHGRVVRQPSYGARLVGYDAGIERMPGVLKVVRDGDFLGVVADHEWAAVKAAQALSKAAVWRETAQLPPDPWAWLAAQPAEVKTIKTLARPGGSEPVRTLEASYRRPYQMHGSIGPSCAVAEMGPGGLLIHTHSQSVFETSAAIAGMLGLAPDKVQAVHMNGSGCYGHNGADDVAADAALMARALPGKAVRVVWSRADEHGWEPYGSAMLTTLKAGVDAKGDVLDWSYQLWSTSHGTRPGGDPGNLLPGRSLAKPFPMPPTIDPGGPNYAAARNAIPLYDFPGQSITSHFVAAMPLRVSSHRSLGAYANVFSIESFMDELAQAAGADPIEYRLRQLKEPRGRAVIQAAADHFGWTAWKGGAGLGRGMAFARYKNLASWLAVCLEVEVDPASSAPRVRRAVIAADAGEIVNPDGLKNQLEGGLIQALSWSLKEEVRHDGRHITSRDWAGYPILRFSEVPDVEVVLIDQPGEPFLGAGEASQGPAAAALANGIFSACGARVRQLPLTADRIAAMRTRLS